MKKIKIKLTPSEAVALRGVLKYVDSVLSNENRTMAEVDSIIDQLSNKLGVDDGDCSYSDYVAETLGELDD